MFAEVLSVSEIGRFDDFFALGGDSILSVQVAARARGAGLPVSPRMVFENPTVQQLAAVVEIGQRRRKRRHPRRAIPGSNR
ncbi:phosphopantetheine attachment site family protein [Mycobacterium xenopi 4042]|uniref:Phosphopantetheine attachment site family protein n=1 Tax=Mycobacterium xenopi 4042 TaxID=1299334 RepID=X8AQQ9_MYCXE|nr:phosphopantetheine attachment site family protein [Mycobacterium xenopi 4042]